MKFKTIFILLFFISFLACGSKDNKPVVPAPIVETKVEKVQDFAYAQKEEFVKSIQLELAKINTDMKELEAKAKTLKKEAVSDSKKKIKALKDQSAKLNKQIDKVKNATESKWEDVKADYKKNSGELNDSVDEMRIWLSEKIAPKNL
jgi:peptidoglycan hydrolase CwlO-like protein